MTNKDATKAVITTIAAFSICATAPWIVLIPVAAGAGIYIENLFNRGDKKKKPKEDEDDE